MAPAFDGATTLIEEFLLNLGIDFREDWTWEDTKIASAVWSAHVHKRRAMPVAKRPVADVLIGAFACRFSGLLTRNRVDLTKLIPNLMIVEP